MTQTLPARQRRGSFTVAIRGGRPHVFRVSILFVVAIVGATMTAVGEQSAAAQSKSVWDGIYTEKQAARGALSFATYCARCHGATNGGDEGRSLAGEPFWKSFRESTVDRLLDYVSRNMPNGAGGTLSADVYAELVAFI